MMDFCIHLSFEKVAKFKAGEKLFGGFYGFSSRLRNETVVKWVEIGWNAESGIDAGASSEDLNFFSWEWRGFKLQKWSKCQQRLPPLREGRIF